MFKLADFIRIQMGKEGIPDDLCFSFSNDAANYILGRGGIFTPDDVNAVKKDKTASLNDGLWIKICSDEIIVGKSIVEYIKMEINANGDVDTTFYHETEDGGVIYGYKCLNQFYVDYYNPETIKFVKGLDKECEHNHDVFLQLLLDPNNSIYEDDYFKYEFGDDFSLTNILNDAIKRFDKSKKY